MLDYYNRIRLEDFCVFSTGVLVGAITALLMVAYISKITVRTDRKLDGAVLVRLKNKVYLSHPRTFAQFFYAFFAVASWMLKGKKEEIKEANEKVGKLLLRLSLLLLFFSLFVDLYFILDVDLPK